MPMAVKINKGNYMHKEVYDGQKIYTPLTLPLYDAILSFNNTIFWKVDSRLFVDLYRQNLTPNHLDIGVGTGRWIRKANPRPFSRLALADINLNSLAETQRNLADSRPETFQENALEEMQIPGTFTSVGCTYLLHCIPGAGFHQKAAVFANAYRLLEPGGVFFGATVCGKDIGRFDRGYLNNRLYNKLGWFHNIDDSVGELREVLREQFDQVDVKKVGEVAFFTARKYSTT
jgi:ubiquinone/menaquinone biosynthesis C-methylase UbiE